MDINSIEIPNTVKVHLVHPQTGAKLYTDGDKKKPVVIEMFGPASDEAVAHRRKVMREATKRMGQGKRGAKMSAEEIEQHNVDRLVALTASVINLTNNGEKVTTDNVRAVYENPRYGWVVEQVGERLGSWEDFLAG